jgi:hypothetical protein
VGRALGATVVGLNVGGSVGVGVSLGVGALVGASVVGLNVGVSVGVGVGLEVGALVGFTDGSSVAGTAGQSSLRGGISSTY